MELAIPIVALGGMYLVSNQNKKNNASGSIKSLKESFITSNNPNNRANTPTCFQIQIFPQLIIRPCCQTPVQT